MREAAKSLDAQATCGAAEQRKRNEYERAQKKNTGTVEKEKTLPLETKARRAPWLVLVGEDEQGPVEEAFDGGVRGGEREAGLRRVAQM